MKFDRSEGCCHKTRLVGAPCPVGRSCPHDALPAPVEYVQSNGARALEYYAARCAPAAEAAIKAVLSEDAGTLRHPLMSDRTPALSTDSAARKAAPIASGVLDYFPLALADVARLSKIGNDKHNPGQPLHWSRGKSDDHADCIVRHMIERGTVDTDGVLHDAKVAWRALAQLQLAIERLRAEGVAYG